MGKMEPGAPQHETKSKVGKLNISKLEIGTPQQHQNRKLINEYKADGNRDTSTSTKSKAGQLNDEQHGNLDTST